MLNQLEMLRIFCVAAECVSFKEAAARLGVSPQSVTRAIKTLEDTVGEPLFYRNTRQMHITDYGEQLAQRGRESIGTLDNLLTSSSKHVVSDMAGVIRITAPISLGRRFLPSILSKINLEHPNIHFELKFSDAITDVIEEQIDIGVRVGFLRDSSYVARVTDKVHFYVVGAPSLIARVGKPETIAQLLQQPSVALINATSGKTWPWVFDAGQQFKHTTPTFVTDDVETELNMVLSGSGFGQIADFLAKPYLESGRLVQVMAHDVPPSWDIYVYRPQRGPVPARIRLVFDRIAEAFSNIRTLEYAQ